MRKEFLKKVKRIVIKIGSRVLTCEDNGLDGRLIGGLDNDRIKSSQRSTIRTVVSNLSSE